MAGGRDSRTAAAERGVWIAAAVLVLVVIVYGGYGHHWSWTGINGHTATLWDWLHLLLLPVAAVILPLWLRHRPRLGSSVRLVVAGLTAAFVALVVAGYMVPWAWTGFTGNRLWDWLNLAALPLAVVLIPVFIEVRSRFGRRHAAIAGAIGVAFVVVVIAGYTIPWAWTGFTGNTLWDWLHLALLPVLVPVAIVPVVTPMAKARMGIQDEAGPAPTEPAAEEPVTPDFADPSTT